METYGDIYRDYMQVIFWVQNYRKIRENMERDLYGPCNISGKKII